LEGEGWEGLEWKGGVARGEASDELCGKGVDVVEVEGGVEWLREGRLLEGGADVGGMAGLDGQDGAGDREVTLVDNCSSSTKVGRNTDSLEDGGESNERSRGG
jgi:hypothetical protein